MKSFLDYLAEAVYAAENPVAGDVFQIEVARDESMIESLVADVCEDGIILEASDELMAELSELGYLEEAETKDWIVYSNKQNVHEFDSHKKAVAAQKRFGPNYKIASKKWWEENKDTVKESDELAEAKYQGREVPLGKPMRASGGSSKFKVYVKNPKGNVVKVNFGDPNMRIKKSNPKRRKSFRARHRCDTAKDRTTARYWSCRAW